MRNSQLMPGVLALKRRIAKAQAKRAAKLA
jgi:hypothetical protein